MKDLLYLSFGNGAKRRSAKTRLSALNLVILSEAKNLHFAGAPAVSDNGANPTPRAKGARAWMANPLGRPVR